MNAGRSPVDVVYWSRFGTGGAVAAGEAAAAIVAESDATRSVADPKGEAAPEQKVAPRPGPEGRGKPAGITGFGK